MKFWYRIIMVNILKCSTTFTIIELFLNKKEWPEMYKSADDCKTVIIWAGN